MDTRSALGAISQLSSTSGGVFRGRDAVKRGVSRNQIAALLDAKVVERVLPDTYRMTATPVSNTQSLRAALLWAGPTAAAAGRSAGEVYRLEGVRAEKPEIVLGSGKHRHAEAVVVHRPSDATSLRVRRYGGMRVTGMEPTLVALAAGLDAEAFEIACEDARRRRLTTVASLRAYLARFRGRRGVAPLRDLLDQIDPVHIPLRLRVPQRAHHFRNERSSVA